MEPVSLGGGLNLGYILNWIENHLAVIKAMVGSIPMVYRTARSTYSKLKKRRERKILNVARSRQHVVWVGLTAFLDTDSERDTSDEIMSSFVEVLALLPALDQHIMKKYTNLKPYYFLYSTARLSKNYMQIDFKGWQPDEILVSKLIARIDKYYVKFGPSINVQIEKRFGRPHLKFGKI